MPIVDDVSAQLKTAMKTKDKGRLPVLRSMRSAFLNEMKRDGSDSVSDEVCQVLLRKLEKQRKESIEAFSQAQREELAETERRELLVIREFLPSLADEAQTRSWVGHRPGWAWATWRRASRSSTRPSGSIPISRRRVRPGS